MLVAVLATLLAGRAQLAADPRRLVIGAALGVPSRGGCG
jgi:hypothetical protein